MTSSFAIVIGGRPADAFDTALAELDVEENVDLPGAFAITLPVKVTSSGDYDNPLRPQARAAVQHRRHRAGE